jgi:hypothetical protein
VTLPATAKWILLALLGLAIAIGVAIAAANLTSQQIGIANESVSAGDALAPALSVPGEETPRSNSPDREQGPGEEEESTLPGESPTLANPEEPAIEEPLPSGEEPSSSQSEGSGEDHGHGPDGDD